MLVKIKYFLLFCLFINFLKLFSQDDNSDTMMMNDLMEVVILKKKKSISQLYNISSNVINVDKEELLKSACCNISESFETNPHIETNFTNSIIGIKQISLFGLKSPYILISEEDLPSIRAGTQVIGLNYIPGTWVESIQINKGTSNVENGYESLTGEINVKLKKPKDDDPFFLNIFRGYKGRNELNIQFSEKLSNKLYSSLFVHGSNRQKKVDKNLDSFLDKPTSSQFNILNRWQFESTDNSFSAMLTLNGFKDRKKIGQISPKNIGKSEEKIWNGSINTNQLKSNFILNYNFLDRPYNNLTFQLFNSFLDYNSFYGFRKYDFKLNTNYLKIYFKSIIQNTMNKIKVGINLVEDDFDESLTKKKYDRSEKSIGGFFEYNYDNLDDFSFNGGVRIDNHNRLNTFITPKFNLKYKINSKSILKLSYGRGKRLSSIFLENLNIFVSNRKIKILRKNNLSYGLKPELADNFGINFNYNFRLNKKNAFLTFDFYRTQFKNQIIADYEIPNEISFYNSDGKSFSNSYLIEFVYDPIKNLELTLAYKYNDVKFNYLSGLKRKALNPEDRIFINLNYNYKDLNIDRDIWRFNFSLHAIGKQRIPENLNSLNGFESKKYMLLNFQLTKIFNKNFELYLGFENLANYLQKNPIIDSNNPFGSNFDSSLIYAPIVGAMNYFGLRYNLN